jgi:hypothetical protein
MEVIPPKNVPLSAVEDKIRDKIFVPARKVAFDRWLAGLERRYQVKLNLGVLERALGQAPAPGK